MLNNLVGILGLPSAPKPSSVDYLVVAGGGGGGRASSGNSYGGGGGGAGGFRTAASFGIGASFTVTIGAGGASGTVGNDSVFSTITSAAGGACFGRVCTTARNVA